MVVLGNHELHKFPDVDTAVDFYKKELEPLGYFVLHNQEISTRNLVIYGGTGFAKYSNSYNANNIICCKAMMGNRQYEIEQTELFEQGYLEGKEKAQQEGKCFICLSHYPVESCLKKFDKDAIYFTGHTHKNIMVRTEDKVLYANNQIGYPQKNKFDKDIFHFKLAKTGLYRNPYEDLADGYHNTTVEDYLKFNEYLGEHIGEGKLIRQCLKKGQLYVIKLKGYYGFFIVSLDGISILKGGAPKKIALSSNIIWIYDNFNIVVEKYISLLTPLREKQVEISNELKKLGFEGTIHGAIVDLNSENHIALDTQDGKISFYNALTPYDRTEFSTLKELLEYMGETQVLDSLTKNLKQKSDEKDDKEEQKFDVSVFSSSSSSLLNYSNDSDINVVNDDFYKVSKKVNQIQRLFSGHVLRDFDIRLAEIEDNGPQYRWYSYKGHVYEILGEGFYLVIEDSLREILTMMDENGEIRKIPLVTIISDSKNKSSQRKGRWVTNSLEETISFYREKMSDYVEEIPKSWEKAIDDLNSKLLK